MIVRTYADRANTLSAFFMGNSFEDSRKKDCTSIILFTGNLGKELFHEKK